MVITEQIGSYLKMQSVPFLRRGAFPASSDSEASSTRSGLDETAFAGASVVEESKVRLSKHL